MNIQEDPKRAEKGAGPLPPSMEGDPAPGELDLVRTFVNTREMDPDREELTDPRALRDWIEARGMRVSPALDAGDLERARTFREALRALLLANAGEALSADAVKILRAAAEEATLEATVGRDGDVTIGPSCSGLDQLIAQIFSAIAAAQETGEWERLKACTSDECQWAFYDRSRNRSRHWCSMGVCGNRAKTRAYRAKRKS
jgi:predicted RNA-binding Zn ribbon-like protein